MCPCVKLFIDSLMLVCGLVDESKVLISSGSLLLVFIVLVSSYSFVLVSSYSFVPVSSYSVVK